MAIKMFLAINFFRSYINGNYTTFQLCYGNAVNALTILSPLLIPHVPFHLQVKLGPLTPLQLALKLLSRFVAKNLCGADLL
uniref:Uncharacterized protein n=1 Tax=Pavo cristatus TaxID=9049 RepID=A0A8C9FE89_PAVCR